MGPCESWNVDENNRMDEQKIIDYYDQCEIDYRINWRLDRSMALHYGYWDWSTWTFGQALKKTNDILTTRAHIKPGERVLDAGCGVGGSSIHLAHSPGWRGCGCFSL
jgi:tocopherol O-methyltransferase